MGNHEAYSFIPEFPIVEFGGAPARQITDSIFYAETGNVYNLNEHNCLVINGADSHDKEFRKEGISWWNEERITRNNVWEAKEALDKYNNTVDFVFSHTGGNEVCRTLGFMPTFSDNRLTEILSCCTYDRHYCAHYHIDSLINSKTRIVYDDIIELY